MANCTMGPWHVDGESALSRKLVIYGGTRETSRTPVAYTVPHAEAEANARLIAAAPDLLRVVKLAEELAFHNPSVSGMLALRSMALDVITKAGGTVKV